MLRLRFFIQKLIRCQAGLSLIEVLFSFGILSLICLSSAKLAVEAQQLTQDTQLKLLALAS